MKQRMQLNNAMKTNKKYILYSNKILRIIVILVLIWVEMYTGFYHETFFRSLFTITIVTYIYIYINSNIVKQFLTQR